MKLYAQGLARRLHEQRIGAAKPAPPNTPAAPTSPANRQKPTVPNSGGGNGYHRPSPNRQKPTDPDTGHAPADRQKPTDPDTGGGGVTTFEPRVAHTVKPLTQAQLNAIDLLVLGHSDSSAANHLGIHRTTLSTWRTNHPAFRAELARRRQEVWGSACERFRNLLNKAVDELEKQLEDEDKTVRFRAASRLLALARHFRPPDEPTDVEGVLTHEARRLNVEKYELHPAQSLVYEVDREEALQLMMKRAREDFTFAGPAPTTTTTEYASGVLQHHLAPPLAAGVGTSTARAHTDCARAPGAPAHTDGAGAPRASAHTDGADPPSAPVHPPTAAGLHGGGEQAPTTRQRAAVVEEDLTTTGSGDPGETCTPQRQTSPEIVSGEVGRG